MSCRRLALVLTLLVSARVPCISAQAIRQEEGKLLLPPNFIETRDGSGISLPVGFNIPSLPSIPFSSAIEAEHQIVDASGQITLHRRILKIARDSKGRTRTDTDLNVTGNSTDTRLVTVQIYDPVARCEITLFWNHSAIRVQYKVYPTPRAKYPILTDDGLRGGLGESLGQSPPPTPVIRHEELGAEVVDGMRLRHGRETSQYPAGYAGQKDAFTIVTDYWYSQELQSFVLVKQLGPHDNVNTLRLRDIRREAPDPSLFTIPKGFAVTKQIRKEFKPT